MTSVTVETTATVVRPWYELARSHIDEVKLHVDDDGLWFSAVDPANVGMLRTTFTHDYDGEPFEVGLPLKRMALISKARKGRWDEPVRLTVGEDEVGIEVDRDGLTLVDTVEAIDPDSIRREPSTGLVTDGMAYKATVPADGFAHAIEHINGGYRAFRITGEDSTLTLTAYDRRSKTPIADETRADFPDTDYAVVDDPREKSGYNNEYYTPDYFDRVAPHIADIVDTVELRWDNDYPAGVAFDGDTVSGEFIVAPRLRRED